MHKDDNLDIWESLAAYIRHRAAQGSLRVTWTKGHATDEDIVKGKATEIERNRNFGADELATQGINLNCVNGVLIKASK